MSVEFQMENRKRKKETVIARDRLPLNENNQNVWLKENKAIQSLFKRNEIYLNKLSTVLSSIFTKICRRAQTFENCFVCEEVWIKIKSSLFFV